LRQLEIAPEAFAAEGVADGRHREAIRVSKSIILREILRPDGVSSPRRRGDAEKTARETS
jgi:hypothetical protein